MSNTIILTIHTQPSLQELLRCIGVLCFDVPRNCEVVQSAVVPTTHELSTTTFTELVVQAVHRLEAAQIRANGPLGAVFLCVQALTHSKEGATTFCQRGFLTIALIYLSESPLGSPDPMDLLVRRSVVATFRNFLLECEDFFERTNTDDVRVLIQFFARLSAWNQGDDTAAYVVRKLLYDATRFMTTFMSTSELLNRMCEVLDADPSLTSDMITMCCASITAKENTWEAAGKITSGRYSQLQRKLWFAMMEFLISLVRNRAIVQILVVQPAFVTTIRLHVAALVGCESVESERLEPILRFLCLVVEATASDAAVGLSAIRDVISAPAILRVFEYSWTSRHALAYAVLILWLLESSRTTEESSASGLTVIRLDILAFVESATARSRGVTELPRLLMCTFGLLAEVLANSDDSNTQHREAIIRLLRRLLLLCAGFAAVDVEDLEAMANEVSGAPYSAATWQDEASKRREAREKVGVLHQSIRCFAHCSPSEIRGLLGSSGSSRVETNFQYAVFVPSIQILSTALDASATFALDAVGDALTMLQRVLGALPWQSIVDYRRLAREQSFVRHCYSLLETSSARLKLQVRLQSAFLLGCAATHRS